MVFLVTDDTETPEVIGVSPAGSLHFEKVTTDVAENFAEALGRPIVKVTREELLKQYPSPDEPPSTDDEVKLAEFSKAMGAALAAPLTARKRTHQFIEVTKTKGVLDATLAEMNRRGVKVLGYDAYLREGGPVWRIKIMEPAP